LKNEFSRTLNSLIVEDHQYLVYIMTKKEDPRSDPNHSSTTETTSEDTTKAKTEAECFTRDLKHLYLILSKIDGNLWTQAMGWGTNYLFSVPVEAK
jgi:hypothetical protein